MKKETQLTRKKTNVSMLIHALPPFVGGNLNSYDPVILCER